MDMEFVGHPHCGLDDATNIAHLLIRMIKDGAAIDINERITLRYKLDPPTHTNENTANTSNKSSWPVKPLYTDGQTRTYSQALRDKQRAADTMSSLKADLQRHHIQASS
uniref:Exonuclease domain-containing protein n=1 Tax=Cuerna arida TaxID=1464854 RepID=A0A1B6F284_9HEMI